MAMNFEELDETTRQHMLAEFEAEEASGHPYRGKGLSAKGIAAFPALMRQAIRSGTEGSLIAELARPDYWLPTEEYEKAGVVRERQVNVRQSAERLGLTEFNTWYVRGLAKRLLDEGVAQCQAYRASQPKWEPADCTAHEGQVFSVRVIYNGHRAKYWPKPGAPEAISIPFGPGCHHTIRRVK